MTSSKLLAIDPGNKFSGYAVIDIATFRPLMVGKVENKKMREILVNETYDEVVIEMIARYGMPVGKTVFDTCVWIGRFAECANKRAKEWRLLYRKDVKMNICGTTKAKDGNIIQALIDRFAPDTGNRGKGYKKDPGWFYGFKADIWQAYALGVTYIDKNMVVGW